MKTSDLIAVFLVVIQGVACQRVKVDKEVEATPGGTFVLHCKFEVTPDIVLTQVTWAKESSTRNRENIAVFHPELGTNYPESSLKGRVHFISASLKDPSISVSDVKMDDTGTYTCEYATYPSGNEHASTTVIILVMPENSASVLPVHAGVEAVTVARCESARGQPPGQIVWETTAAGNQSTTSKPDVNSTVTVISEYQLIPTAADNGRDITCIIKHRSQDKDNTYKMKLAVEYPPKVSIKGYDGQWFLGLRNVELVCLADANPPPATLEWTATSGQMPKSVQMNGNKLTIPKVDEDVNTTFVCEVTNQLGSGKSQVTTLVTDKPPQSSSKTTGIIVGILGTIILVAVIATGAVIICRRKRSNDNGDGPPKYKPPPPTRTGVSSEKLNKSHSTMVESQPLSLYSRTTLEPVTDLDAYDIDDENMPNGDAGAPNGLDDSKLLHKSETQSSASPQQSIPPRHLNQQEDQGGREALSHIAREDSFISSAVVV